MTGAIEFLRKAKVIHEACRDDATIKCGTCPVSSMCGTAVLKNDPADLVRKVMDYQIKEVSDETKKA
ncbi:MAG: hypothetical protein K0R34_3300 [Herbinix sp.]|jgi:hypothetical protein|nr:hypothetical protein [Herbinix sp.]